MNRFINQGCFCDGLFRVAVGTQVEGFTLVDRNAQEMAKP